MTWASWIAAISALISIGALIVAIKSKVEASKIAEDQRYLGLLHDYKSADMLAAIERLYAFERECNEICKKTKCKTNEERNKIFKEKYEGIKKQELKTISADKIKKSLHYQRRLVSHFYCHMYNSIYLKLIPEKPIFTFWTTGTLKIIPDILEKIGKDPDKHLTDLYNMAKNFRNGGGK